jgi:hypothetical protein
MPYFFISLNETLFAVRRPVIEVNFIEHISQPILLVESGCFYIEEETKKWIVQ